MAKVVQQTLFFFLLVFLCNSNIYAQDGGLDCSDPQPFCSDAARELTFSNITGGDVNFQGLGCLNSTRNASWYFIRIDQAGELAFDIQQWVDGDGDSRLDRGERQLDVDFIAWGPFDNTYIDCDLLALGCDNNGDGENLRPEECVNNVDDPDYYVLNQDNTNIVDCSYARTPEDNIFIETLTIPNAQSGEYYFILITNFSDEDGVIQLQQTNLGEDGAGTTDCSVLEPGVGPDIAVCGTSEFPITIEGRFPRVVGPPEIPAAIRFQWERAELGTTNFVPQGGLTDIPLLEVFTSGVYQLIGYSDIAGTIEVGRDDLQVLDVSAIEIIVNGNVAEESFAGSYTITAEVSATTNATPAIDVQTLGFNDFEYRLDRDLGNGFIEYREFQSSPVFSGVPPGDYRVTARYANCPDNEGVSSVIMILGYPKYFTPNGDSFHDTWNIINPELSVQLPVIYIFDRYGKLLKQLRPGGAGWDGTYNGRNMPSADYWFRVEFNEPTDPNMRRRVFAGNFSLIR